MKIEGYIEEIFAHAVAMDQNGGLRNTIFAIGREIYIMNYDHSVMIRFRLRASENPFDEPVSFKANDYDSNTFFIEDGKIVFVTEKNGFERRKTCGVGEFTPEIIKTTFSNLLKKEATGYQEVVLPANIKELLEDDLSHIEFSGVTGETLKMIQRNVYSGSTIAVQEKTNQGGFFTAHLTEDFGPVGIKTKDYGALFYFQDALKFRFPIGGNDDFIIVKSLQEKKRDMTVLIGQCLYDELIELNNEKKEVQNGRQKPQIRRH